jgi:hypothetical protein
MYQQVVNFPESKLQLNQKEKRQTRSLCPAERTVGLTMGSTPGCTGVLAGDMG